MKRQRVKFAWDLYWKNKSFGACGSEKLWLDAY